MARLYPSIPHLPGSRCASDRTVPPGIAKRCVDASSSERGQEVIVQEKLDGSCVAVVRREGQLLAYGREGNPCAESRNEARRWFAAWLSSEADRFDFLGDGQILAGEWLALVHGTRYALAHAPFVPFDLLIGGERATVDVLGARLRSSGLAVPRIVHRGGPIPIADADVLLSHRGLHGAIDLPEGLIYRVERDGIVRFVAKWVRPSKVDGAYLPENSGAPALYHWIPP